MASAAGVVSVFLLTGCLYSTHHFNTGRLLEPGRSSFTLGAGSSKTVSYGCPEDRTAYSYRDSTRTVRCVSVEPGTMDTSKGQSVFTPKFLDQEISSSSSINGSLGYRLGVHGRLGPLTGMEIGLHLESPTNPVTGEFDLKLGLPAPVDRPYHHSLSAGWGIGAWADNSWFLEYAASRAYGASDLFFNYRATYLASQFADLREAEDTRHFDSRRRLIHQAALGFKCILPEGAVLPDFIAPEAVLTYPLAPAGYKAIPDFALDDRVWGFNLGLGWSFP
ncbi:MAG TPA: hypothetical protein VJ385_19385 [Fibrobacteria bacterium]|nr:hypothetical protein [Fibrobacteria bacterium]